MAIIHILSPSEILIFYGLDPLRDLYIRKENIYIYISVGETREPIHN